MRCLSSVLTLLVLWIWRKWWCCRPSNRNWGRTCCFWFVPVQNHTRSSTQNIQSVQPVTASSESLQSPTPPSSSSRKRIRSKYVSSSERNAWIKLLHEIQSQSVADFMIAEAQSELHMSGYSSRKQLLDVSRSSWIAMVDSLLVLYRKLYVECSAAADRYLTFQTRWVAGVSSLLSNPILSPLSLELQDACSVLHSLGCCCVEALLQCDTQLPERACVCGCSQCRAQSNWREALLAFLWLGIVLVVWCPQEEKGASKW